MIPTELPSISDTGPFTPHGHCYLWNTDLVWLHAASDSLITLAYLSIPVALLYIKRRRLDIDLRLLVTLFAAFILACGLTHLLAVWNIWHADYWFSGTVKAVTGVISAATATISWWKIPLILAWPSQAQLRSSNEALQREVRRRREMYSALAESETQLREAFDHAPIGKALVALDGHWLKANPALCNLLGYTLQELAATDFQSIINPDELAANLRQRQRLLEGGVSIYQLENRFRHKQGKLVWVLLSETLVRSESGAPRYFIAQIIDISARKRVERQLRQVQVELEARVATRTEELAAVNQRLQKANQRLERMARTDPLTGLPNRWELIERLEHQLHESQRYATEWCLMLIDVDNFKVLNDSHGHVIGDRTLEAFGSSIRAHTRDSDFAARYGGDEFCVIVPHADIFHTVQLAEKLRETLAELNLCDSTGARVTVTCSIGIVQWAATMDTAEKVIDAADSQLYLAKDAGRNCVFAGVG